MLLRFSFAETVVKFAIQLVQVLDLLYDYVQHVKTGEL